MYSHKHLADFLKMKCSIDIQKLLHPKINCKEIVECMSILTYLREWLHNHKEVELIIDCGSGKFSVLGLLYAFNYKVPVISVDPREDLHFVNLKTVRNFSVVKGYLGQIDIDKAKKVLLLCNHSHVPLSEVKEFLNKLDTWAYLTVPCCVDNKLNNYEGKCFKDIHNWSEKNNIYFYTKDY